MDADSLRVGPEYAGQRADRAIPMLRQGLSRSQVQKYLARGFILINGRAAGKNDRLKEGDSLTFVLPEPEPAAAAAQEIPLCVVYEDEYLLVVNKPRGMVVHPAAGNPEGTLVNALLYHCGNSLSGIGGVLRPGIVHRIDKNTSGLLIVAKNDFAHKSLAAQMKAHSIRRVYEAVVLGCLKDDDGTVDAPIGRHPVKRKQMAVTEKNSKRAVTHYHVIARYSGFTHVELRLETGRTHQIRVHMAYLGHPVAGDTVYGPAKRDYGLSGQCLHARVIGFVHPATGQYMEFTSELPDYFQSFLRKLRAAG